MVCGPFFLSVAKALNSKALNSNSSDNSMIPDAVIKVTRYQCGDFKSVRKEINVLTHTHAYTHICTHAHICTNTHTHLQVYTQIHAHSRKHIHKHIHTHTQTHKHSYTLTRARAWTHARTHTLAYHSKYEMVIASLIACNHCSSVRRCTRLEAVMPHLTEMKS